MRDVERFTISSRNIGLDRARMRPASNGRPDDRRRPRLLPCFHDVARRLRGEAEMSGHASAFGRKKTRFPRVKILNCRLALSFVDAAEAFVAVRGPRTRGAVASRLPSTVVRQPHAPDNDVAGSWRWRPPVNRPRVAHSPPARRPNSTS